jgi:hypothetical protein
VSDYSPRGYHAQRWDHKKKPVWAAERKPVRDVMEVQLEEGPMGQSRKWLLKGREVAGPSIPCDQTTAV